MRQLLFVLAFAALGGCATGPFGHARNEPGLSGPEPLFSKAEDLCLDRPSNLIWMTKSIGTAGVGVATDNFVDNEAQGKVDLHDKSYECKRVLAPLAKSVRAMDIDPSPTATETGSHSDAMLARRRNELIDALIASSNRKCSRYTMLIKNSDSLISSSFNIAAIVTGGLGAFVGGPAAAKALSGISAILTGSRSAIDEAVFARQTIQVLAAAYEKARARQRVAITNREACSIDQYTFMRGIEDALAYHSKCSVVSGLEETGSAVARTDNPGFAQMRLAIYDLHNLDKQVHALGTPGEKPEEPLGQITVDDMAAVAKFQMAEAKVADLTAKIASDEVRLVEADKPLAKPPRAAKDGDGKLATADVAADAPAASQDGGVAATASPSMAETSATIKKRIKDNQDAQRTAQAEVEKVRAQLAALFNPPPVAPDDGSSGTRVCPYDGMRSLAIAHNDGTGSASDKLSTAERGSTPKKAARKH